MHRNSPFLELDRILVDFDNDKNKLRAKQRLGGLYSRLIGANPRLADDVLSMKRLFDL